MTALELILALIVLGLVALLLVVLGGNADLAAENRRLKAAIHPATRKARR